VPVGVFYIVLTPLDANPKAVGDAWKEQALLDMAAALVEMDSPEVRRALLDLCTAVAESGSG
jgi:hypothetical protein